LIVNARVGKIVGLVKEVIDCVDRVNVREDIMQGGREDIDRVGEVGIPVNG
jgi:hypothetical protein